MLNTPLPSIALALTMLAAFAFSDPAEAQGPDGFNYDEANVPNYTLPDPLTFDDGSPVLDADAWRSRRRGEILELFRAHVYGRAPGRPESIRFEDGGTIPDALDGKATRKRVLIHLGDGPEQVTIDLALYVPNSGPGPFPVFLGLNFAGNHSVDPDPRIPLPTSWMPDGREGTTEDHRATDSGRGKSASRWPQAMIIDRGYAVATAYCGDIDPDFDDGFTNGVHALSEGPRSEDSWGTLAAWAWGLSRAVDALEADPQIDAGRVCLLGHSRLGKAALWAGAQDDRFALVVSNMSGEGGAALARRKFGETTERINTRFPHWFAAKFRDYNGREDDIPVDQHMLISLIAPRPVLVNSATEDLWADPRGEFLSAKGADPVYRLLGTDGLASRDMPGPSVLIYSTIGYHLRPGEHDVTEVDWTAYLDFADRQLPAPR